MISERIQDDLKKAMKARDSATVSVLRMVIADLKNERIAKGSDLETKDEVQVLKRAVKQREEAAEQYREGGRPELAEKEESEAAVLVAYLPQMISGDELLALVKGAIEATGAESMKDMGKVMKALMAEHGDRLDGKAVQQAVRSVLGA
jgi:uncharacterized protein YqeY